MMGSEESEGGFEAEVGLVGNSGVISGDNAVGEYGSTLGSAAMTESFNVVVLYDKYGEANEV